ncbi:hypothetical protein NDA15_004084 [Ustilago hordei]|nr:hypothetical protein NDA15_004084 [Ustilago hordei]
MDAQPTLYTDSQGCIQFCHGPGCSRSRRVTGSYGRSTGIKDLVDTSREHGCSAVSMETMDSYGLTCKGGPSTATRRTKLKEQAQPRRGPSSRSMQMVTTQGLERQEPKELSLIKGEGAVSKESTPAQEAQGCQVGEAPEQYSMKKVLSGEESRSSIAGDAVKRYITMLSHHQRSSGSSSTLLTI